MEGIDLNINCENPSGMGYIIMAVGSGEESGWKVKKKPIAKIEAWVPEWLNAL